MKIDESVMKRLKGAGIKLEEICWHFVSVILHNKKTM